MKLSFVCENTTAQLGGDKETVFHSATLVPILPKGAKAGPALPGNPPNQQQLKIEKPDPVVLRPLTIEAMASQPFLMGKTYVVDISESPAA